MNLEPSGAFASSETGPASSTEVRDEIACKRCGYNLRGLREDGRCPECGTAVGLSVRGDLLQFSDPAWVETVARGMYIILWGILAHIIVAVLSVVLSAMLGRGGSGPGQWLGLIPALITFYGSWLLTMPDPSGTEP